MRHSLACAAPPSQSLVARRRRRRYTCAQFACYSRASVRASSAQLHFTWHWQRSSSHSGSSASLSRRVKHQSLATLISSANKHKVPRANLKCLARAPPEPARRSIRFQSSLSICQHAKLSASNNLCAGLSFCGAISRRSPRAEASRVGGESQKVEERVRRGERAGEQASSATSAARPGRTSDEHSGAPLGVRGQRPRSQEARTGSCGHERRAGRCRKGQANGYTASAFARSRASLHPLLLPASIAQAHN